MVNDVRQQYHSTRHIPLQMDVVQKSLYIDSPSQMNKTNHIHPNPRQMHPYSINNYSILTFSPRPIHHSINTTFGAQHEKPVIVSASSTEYPHHSNSGSCHRNITAAYVRAKFLNIHSRCLA